MKLIIDIDEEEYIQICDEPCTKLGIAVRNGIPLDDVKAEIEKLNPVDYGSMFSWEGHQGAQDMQRDVLQILDNIAIGK